MVESLITAIAPRKAGAAGAARPEWGTVYGTLLNLRSDLASLESAMQAPPYNAPPVAPVLYIKPPNTYTPHGGTIAVSREIPQIHAAATLGVVFGRDATRVSAGDAASFIAGYTLAIELWLPHDDIYRPAIAERCRDGFLPIGPSAVGADAVGRLETLRVALDANGHSAMQLDLGDLMRPVPQLITDVTDFMTLAKRDVLLAAVPLRGVPVHAGDRLTATCDGFEPLEVMLCAEVDTQP